MRALLLILALALQGETRSDALPEPPVQAPAGQGKVLPARFHFRAVLENSLNANKNKPGDTVRMSSLDDEAVDGIVVIPKNARLTGRIVEAKASSAGDPESRLSIVIEQARWKGHVLPLNASIVAQGRTKVSLDWKPRFPCVEGMEPVRGLPRTLSDCAADAERSAGGEMMKTPILSHVELRETPEGRTVLVKQEGNVVLTAGMLFVLRHMENKVPSVK